MDLHALTWTWRRARAAWAWLAFAACACSPPQPARRAGSPSPEVAPAGTPQALLPLPDGYVIRYRAWLSGATQPEQVIFQVEREGASRVNLRSGSSVQRLEFVADGVRVRSGGYLLRTPLEQGAEWQGPTGDVRVSAMEQTLEVPAGRFSGCLETTEVAGLGSQVRTIVTVFCPGVGIAAIRVESGGRQERFELDSFGPRVDIAEM